MCSKTYRPFIMLMVGLVGIICVLTHSKVLGEKKPLTKEGCHTDGEILLNCNTGIILVEDLIFTGSGSCYFVDSDNIEFPNYTRNCNGQHSCTLGTEPVLMPKCSSPSLCVEIIYKCLDQTTTEEPSTTTVGTTTGGTTVGTTTVSATTDLPISTTNGSNTTNQTKIVGAIPSSNCDHECYRRNEVIGAVIGAFMGGVIQTALIGYLLLRCCNLNQVIKKKASRPKPPNQETLELAELSTTFKECQDKIKRYRKFNKVRKYAMAQHTLVNEQNQELVNAQATLNKDEDKMKRLTKTSTFTTSFIDEV